MKRELDAELKPVIADLKNNAVLKQYLVNMPLTYPDFITYFRSLEKVKAREAASFYKLTGIERTYCYHLLSGKKIPGRDKILLLCLTADLSILETQVALEAGRVPLLSAAYRRDVVIAYALEKALGVKQANDLLLECGEDQLS